MVGIAYYRVYAFNYMAKHKVLDGKVTFNSLARTNSIMWIYFKGVLVILGVVILASISFSALIGSFYFSFPPSLEDIEGATGSLAAFAGAITYVATLLVIGVLLLVWITQPIIEHVVTGITITGSEHLDTIAQRTADGGADAEGFADALDIGGGI